MKIVDLSIFLENDVVSDPPPFKPQIHYVNHTDSFPRLAQFFPGLQPGDIVVTAGVHVLTDGQAVRLPAAAVPAPAAAASR